MELLKKIGFAVICILLWPFVAVVVYMEVRRLKKRRREVDKELLRTCDTLKKQAEHTLKLSRELAKINPGTFHCEK